MMAALDTMLDTVVDKLRREWQKEWYYLCRARRKGRYWYIAYCLCVVLLWVLLAVSLVSEALTGSSVSAHLWPGLELPAILNIGAVRRTAETVGFGSILIVWIYAALDKTELGFQYSDLLRAMYPTYSRFVIGHLIAMMLCVWLSESGMLEGALLSLLLIIMGGVIHWRAISSLAFNSVKRRQLAIDEWNREIEEWDEKKTWEKQDFDPKTFLFRIADTLSAHYGGSAAQMQQCFASALCRFTKTFAPREERPEQPHVQERVQLLLDISQLWDRAVRDRTAEERTRLMDEVLCACTQSPASLGPICAGCVLWLYRSCAGSGSGEAPLQESRLFRLLDELDSLRERLRGHGGHLAIPYIDEVFTLLVWMHFLSGNIRLQEKLLIFSPKGEQRDLELLQAAAACVFPLFKENREYKEERARLAIAYRQMFVPCE